MSGSVRPVSVTSELPSDLPKEMKEKFEVRDLAAAAAVAVESQEVSSKGKTKRKQKTSKKEDQEGRFLAKISHKNFVYPNRRPIKDPIWIGEKLHYSISYLGVPAGELTLEILPFKKVGNRKAYHVRGEAASSAVFSIFYRLHDIVESYIDYEGFFSHRFHLLLDETKQTRDALELNDSEKRQTYYWNRWHPKNAEFRETQETGPIEPFSQDSVSALFYLRALPLLVGSVVTIPVVSEGKTWEAICNIVRREEMDTPLGKSSTIVIQPDTKFHGILKKNGDSFLWLTDDERRFPVRLEAKVKIGTVVASLKKVELGTPPKEEPLVTPSPTASNSAPQ